MADLRTRLTTKGRATADTAQRRYDTAVVEHASVAFVDDLYRTDAEANGSVLGSAVALRLFLFVVTATTVIVSLINLFGLNSLFAEHLEASVTTGEIAVAIDGVNWATSLWIFLTGSVLTLWAGRSLVKTLAASSGACWGLTARQSKPTVLAMLAATGVMLAAVAAASIFTDLRNAAGLGVAVASWGATIALFTVVWFLVLLTLPRAVGDPGALLPGSLVFGVFNAALQWFIQLYLPNRIERSVDRLGSLAITVATLGTFFFIGRLMTASIVITAVTYRRIGSVTALVFALPGLSALARRSARLRDYFGLTLEDRPGKHPRVVSAPLPDPVLEGADEHLGGDADDEHVDDHLAQDRAASLLPDGHDVAEADRGERGDREVDRIEPRVEP